MAMMLSNLYSALVQAGASDEVAKKAAEELAGQENRFSRLETDIAGVKGELALLRWMVGFNLAMTVAVVGRLFINPH